MKQLPLPSRFTGAARAAGRGLVLAVLIGCGAGLVSGFNADAPTSPGSGNPSFSAGGGGGDETVGTLPSTNGGSTLDVLRFGRLVRPSLYVQGPIDALYGALVGVRGDRRVLAHPQPNGELRLVFVGDAQIVFERDALISGGLDVGVALPAAASILRSGALWNGQDLSWSTSAQALPIAHFAASGLLDQAPVVAAVATAEHGRTRVRAQGGAGLVVLTQMR
ncbi:MAG: hypothetical protein JNK02_14815 [Planctomycetes bacterium]|nr:hypothetical protein [Planctomycetota bacterium]